ncbi:MAG: glycosyltransferase [Solirubrobacterales bacterium]|nr:glycosyltransferase [Solirubrobacterales bacterium]
MRIVALLAVHNERRFIGACLEHLGRQGVDTYLIDNCSTDGTAEIAQHFTGRGLIGYESFPREGGVYRWRALLERKEQLARELDADWFIHLDADEVRLPPAGFRTLADALEHVDRRGANAVDFKEFTFVPTREEPDHDHPGYADTLRTYYPFQPIPLHRLNAWRRTDDAELAWSGGHRVRFDGLRVWPTPFTMRHYLFLSVPHAVEKYAERHFDAEELAAGWHGWRARVTAEATARLPSREDMRVASDDTPLDPTNPLRSHLVEDLWTPAG